MVRQAQVIGHVASGLVGGSSSSDAEEPVDRPAARVDITQDSVTPRCEMWSYESTALRGQRRETIETMVTEMRTSVKQLQEVTSATKVQHSMVKLEPCESL